MAEKQTRGMFAKVLEERIYARVRMFAPNDRSINEALLRIGILIETEAKRNIRRNRLIDTGTLLNSIRHEVRTNQAGGGSVEIGSFGVPYAAAHEFGFAGPVTVRAHTRVINQAFGKPIDSVIVGVASHVRQVNIRARPYLRPAADKVRGEILDIISELWKNK